MTIPQPNPKEIEEFVRLYKQKTGVSLNPAEALEVATRALQLYFLVSGHALARIETEERIQQERRRQQRAQKRGYMKKHALPLIPHETPPEPSEG